MRVEGLTSRFAQFILSLKGNDPRGKGNHSEFYLVCGCFVKYETLQIPRCRSNRHDSSCCSTVPGESACDRKDTEAQSRTNTQLARILAMRTGYGLVFTFLDSSSFGELSFQAFDPISQ